MATALTPIAWQSLSTTATTITFSSIPSTYRDLMLVIRDTITSGGVAPYVRFNGDATSGNYFQVSAWGNGSTTSSGSATSQTGLLTTFIGADDITPSVTTIHIMDYSATDKHKTTLHRYNRPVTGNSPAGVSMESGRWASTAAITTVAIVISGDTFAAGSTFALYGVAA